MPSEKILARKQKRVNALAESVKEAESVVFTSYQGLTVAQDTAMRKALRDENVQYSVVKNTQALRAFGVNGIDGLDEILKGPTAIAWSNEDVTAAPRLIKKFVDEYKKIEIKGGILDGKLGELETIVALANIPAVEELYGKLVSNLIFPVTSLAMTLNALAEKGAAEGKENVSDLVVAKEAAEAPAEEAAKTPAEETAEATAEVAAENTEKAETAPAAETEVADKPTEAPAQEGGESENTDTE